QHSISGCQYRPRQRVGHLRNADPSATADGTDKVEEKRMREFDRRPWGTYTVLEEGRNFKVKRIEVLPGKRLSYQKHSQRAEHWVVVEGTAKVTLDGKE